MRFHSWRKSSGRPVRSSFGRNVSRWIPVRRLRGRGSRRVGRAVNVQAHCSGKARQRHVAHQRSLTTSLPSEPVPREPEVQSQPRPRILIGAAARRAARSSMEPAAAIRPMNLRSFGFLWVSVFWVNRLKIVVSTVRFCPSPPSNTYKSPRATSRTPPFGRACRCDRPSSSEPQYDRDGVRIQGSRWATNGTKITAPENRAVDRGLCPPLPNL